MTPTEPEQTPEPETEPTHPDVTPEDDEPEDEEE